MQNTSSTLWTLGAENNTKIPSSALSRLQWIWNLKWSLVKIRRQKMRLETTISTPHTTVHTWFNELTVLQLYRKRRTYLQSWVWTEACVAMDWWGAELEEMYGSRQSGHARDTVLSDWSSPAISTRWSGWRHSHLCCGIFPSLLYQQKNGTVLIIWCRYWEPVWYTVHVLLLQTAFLTRKWNVNMDMSVATFRLAEPLLAPNCFPCVTLMAYQHQQNEERLLQLYSCQEGHSNTIIFDYELHFCECMLCKTIYRIGRIAHQAQTAPWQSLTCPLDVASSSVQKMCSKYCHTCARGPAHLGFCCSTCLCTVGSSGTDRWTHQSCPIAIR